MLYSDSPSADATAEDGTVKDSPAPRPRIAYMRQHPGILPADVAGLATADLSELAAGQHASGEHKARLVLSDTLAAVWPAPEAGQVRVAPPGQPATGVWWELIDELDATGRPDLLVAADYDPDLRYLCLTAFETA
jgi:hypothetical protein